MDKYTNDSDFNKDVIYSKLAELSEQYENEVSKSDEERDLERERELMYATFIQGLKLNTFYRK